MCLTHGCLSDLSARCVTAVRLSQWTVGAQVKVMQHYLQRYGHACRTAG